MNESRKTSPLSTGDKKVFAGDILVLTNRFIILILPKQTSKIYYRFYSPVATLAAATIRKTTATLICISKRRAHQLPFVVDDGQYAL